MALSNCFAATVRNLTKRCRSVVIFVVERDIVIRISYFVLCTIGKIAGTVARRAGITVLTRIRKL